STASPSSAGRSRSAAAAAPSFPATSSCAATDARGGFRRISPASSARREPSGCGGGAVFPGDVIVCDDDGAVVIPQNLAAFVAEEGAEHERMESFIVGEVERGAKLPGLYPMNDETKERNDAAKK